MPKIWLPNTEETQVDKPTLRTFAAANKYLWSLGDHDIAVLPKKPTHAFISYIKKIKKLTVGFDCIIFKMKRFLVDSILDDPNALKALKHFGKTANHYYDPYLQSAKIINLAEVTKIPFIQTNKTVIADGIIAQLNCKAAFKNFCNKYGIPNPRGFILQDIAQLPKYLAYLEKENITKVILKKSLAIGGNGNIAGNTKNILAKVNLSSCANQSFVIEQYLDLNFVCGTLVNIDETGVSFIGVDVHISENNSWQGLFYPIFEPGIHEQVKEYSLVLGKAFAELGVKGVLNIDFGIQLKNNKAQAFALESNFRHNGFSLILNFTRPGRFLHYYKNYKTTAKNFAEALAQLKQLKFARQPLLANDINAEAGVILVDCDDNSGKCGLLTFGPNPLIINQMLNVIFQQFVQR